MTLASERGYAVFPAYGDCDFCRHETRGLRIAVGGGPPTLVCFSCVALFRRPWEGDYATARCECCHAVTVGVQYTFVGNVAAVCLRCSGELCQHIQ